MAIYNDIYAGVKSFLEDTLTELASKDVPDQELSIEIMQDYTGAEKTGIKLSKLPTLAVKSYIDGARDITFKLALESKQAVTPDTEAFIAYSVYLNNLGDAVEQRIYQGHRPVLPTGVRFEEFKQLTSSALLFTDAAFSSYTADIQFTFKITRS